MELQDWVKLYEGTRLSDYQSTDVRIKGRRGEGEAIGSIDAKAKPNRNQSLSVKETRAFYDYRETQKEAVAREDIPLGYKEFVKDYFDSLTPPTGASE